MQRVRIEQRRVLRVLEIVEPLGTHGCPAAHEEQLLGRIHSPDLVRQQETPAGLDVVCTADCCLEELRPRETPADTFSLSTAGVAGLKSGAPEGASVFQVVDARHLTSREAERM
jgi:hypothetical protein